MSKDPLIIAQPILERGLVGNGSVMSFGGKRSQEYASERSRLHNRDEACALFCRRGQEELGRGTMKFEPIFWEGCPIALVMEAVEPDFYNGIY